MKPIVTEWDLCDDCDAEGWVQVDHNQRPPERLCVDCALRQPYTPPLSRWGAWLVYAAPLLLTALLLCWAVVGSLCC